MTYDAAVFKAPRRPFDPIQARSMPDSRNLLFRRINSVVRRLKLLFGRVKFRCSEKRPDRNRVFFRANREFIHRNREFTAIGFIVHCPFHDPASAGF
jgi:hypothetical protein